MEVNHGEELQSPHYSIIKCWHRFNIDEQTRVMMTGSGPVVVKYLERTTKILCLQEGEVYGTKILLN